MVGEPVGQAIQQISDEGGNNTGAEHTESRHGLKFREESGDVLQAPLGPRRRIRGGIGPPARTRRSRLLGHPGQLVIITKRGEPVAQLLPFGDGKRPFTGSALVEWIGATSHHRSRSTEDIEARIADAQGDWD